MSTKIQWCDETLNPVEAWTIPADGEKSRRGWHCERVSAGCQNCYAESQNVTARFLGTGLAYNRAARDKVEFRLNEKTLTQPMRWKRPRIIFWHDMDDLFGEWIPDEWIDRHAAVVALTPQHRHIWLTKRPERMRAYMTSATTTGRVWYHWMKLGRAAEIERDPTLSGVLPWPLPNLILATTIEDQEQADRRVPDLLATPATCRMVSVEPQLGPITLAPERTMAERVHKVMTAGPSEMFNKRGPGLDWVIQGGESGSGARPFDVGWARDLRDQCKDAGVAYFLKQLGSRPVGLGEDLCDQCFLMGPGGARRYHGTDCDGRQLRSSHGSDESEWPEDLRGCRAFPDGMAVRNA